jgi:hypothetical protein
MSDRRAGARKTVTKWAAKIGAWHRWQYVKHFQAALVALATHSAVEEIVAQFGDKIPLMPYSPTDDVEEVVGRMMAITAFAWADPTCQPVSPGEIVKSREEWEKARSKAIALLSGPDRKAYLHWLNLFMANQAPLADPIVERRPPTRKEFDGNVEIEWGRARSQAMTWLSSGPDREAYLHRLDLLEANQASLNDPIVERRPLTRKKYKDSDANYDHARAVWARVQAEARNIFGEAADHVADVFVYAVSGIEFGPDDRRMHPPDRKVRRKR